MGRALDWLSAQIAEAVTDIRRRVVEEPWFGKPLDGPVAGLADTSDMPQEIYDAHAWSPDPRITEALRAEGHERQPSPPAEQARGIDF